MSTLLLLTSVLSCYSLIMLIIYFIYPFNVWLDNQLYPSSCRRERNLFSRITYVNDNKDDAQGSAHRGSTMYYPGIYAPSRIPPYRCSPSHRLLAYLPPSPASSSSPSLLLRQQLQINLEDLSFLGRIYFIAVGLGVQGSQAQISCSLTADMAWGMSEFPRMRRRAV